MQHATFCVSKWLSFLPRTLSNWVPGNWISFEAILHSQQQGKKVMRMRFVKEICLPLKGRLGKNCSTRAKGTTSSSDVEQSRSLYSLLNLAFPYNMGHSFSEAFNNGKTKNATTVANMFFRSTSMGMLKKWQHAAATAKKGRPESESLSALIPSNPFSSFIIFTPLLL